MLPIQFFLVLFLMICHVSVSDNTRRIEGGQILTTNKPYVVYLVKASLSAKNYDYWLCGGALVTENFILTSAACVQDVDYLYAIAGYNKYVTDTEININECTREKKKKVIFTCVPFSYNISVELEKWSYIDIALAKVESPYDLSDTSYNDICSYTPTIIPINYDPKYQMSDIDALVMGWGHASLWRKPHDSVNYNSPDLNYASTLIMDKEECKKHYEVYPFMQHVIDQYMICTLEAGNIDDRGETIAEPPLIVKGCGLNPKNLAGDKGTSVSVVVLLELSSFNEKTRKELPEAKGYEGTQDVLERCEAEHDYDVGGTILIENTRRQLNKTRKIYNFTTSEYIKKVAQEKNAPLRKTRKNGICQNDHGGPLVTWVGKREVLIGIASVFKVTEENECIGPFLYTSTQCNGAFIDCVLNFDSPKKTQNVTTLALCDSPPSVKGFDTVRNHISWKDHPAGPADNEIFESPNSVKPEENFNTARQDQNLAYARLPENEMYKNQEMNKENSKYAGQVPNAAYGYPDNEKNLGSANYAVNERIKNNMFAPKAKYVPDENVARVGDDRNIDSGLVMRPQRPLRI